MIPVVVINLPKSADRRAYIEKHLADLGIRFRLFRAIDGADLSPAERARYEPTMPAGAMGCAASHLGVLREIAEGPDAFACVLEDDTKVSPQLVRFLHQDVLQSLGAFDVLRLDCRPQHRPRLRIPIADVDGITITASQRQYPSMVAQIFSRSGAQKIVAKISSLRVALDVALFVDSYVMGLRVIETRPALACDFSLSSSFASTIGPGRLPPYSWLETILDRRLRKRDLRNFMSFVQAWGLTGLLRARVSADAVSPAE
jgi:glycosyl transferase family 25